MMVGMTLMIIVVKIIEIMIIIEIKIVITIIATIMLMVMMTTTTNSIVIHFRERFLDCHHVMFFLTVSYFQENRDHLATMALRVLMGPKGTGGTPGPRGIEACLACQEYRA